MGNKRVVITGMGTITPIGNNLSEYTSALKNGVSGCEEIKSFDTSKFKTKFACEVKSYDPLDYFDRKESRKMDIFSQFGMIAAEEAIINSEINLDKINKNRVGVIWGSGVGGIETFQNELINFAQNDKNPRFNPFFIPKLIPDICPGLIAIKFDFRGPNFATVSACASGSNAIIDAYNYIISDTSDIIITGGSESAVNETGVGGFNALKALSERNDSPETASRPFDKDRDGFVLGEGGGALILEEYNHAKSRDAKIYGEVIGFGMSCDAHHITAPHPEGEGARLVMENALKNAEIQIEDIDHINVHGTSTPLGDKSEIKAIENVFGNHAERINICSTKSMTGHLLGAAGAIESIAALISINESFIPPTINHFNHDEEINQKLNLTLNKYQARDVNVAMSNTFGFGGHNTSIVFKKYN
ncbi:MAG: beta-ketoacyl-[acyl-carrier-protein] synthase II [Flammeovirgaceae bacterium TMED290]|nr:MAG: beta-ketoacyl-[acyl-carrier-protein] synthase II [Flammeovirgaceae bacterium TMED290]|tara:strand:- start:11778 stop:13028 length:1251 start_codon:yes stop_codon:yes gene_type:complete